LRGQEKVPKEKAARRLALIGIRRMPTRVPCASRAFGRSPNSQAGNDPGQLKQGGSLAPKSPAMLRSGLVFPIVLATQPPDRFSFGSFSLAEQRPIRRERIGTSEGWPAGRKKHKLIESACRLQECMLLVGALCKRDRYKASTKSRLQAAPTVSATTCRRRPQLP